MEYRYGGGSRQRGSGAILGLARGRFRGMSGRTSADRSERCTDPSGRFSQATPDAVRIVRGNFCKSLEALRGLLWRYVNNLDAVQIADSALIVRARFLVAVLNYAIKFDRATACLHFQTACLLARCRTAAQMF